MPVLNPRLFINPDSTAFDYREGVFIDFVESHVQEIESKGLRNRTLVHGQMHAIIMLSNQCSRIIIVYKPCLYDLLVSQLSSILR